jgi:hypothetical protein
MMSTTLRFPFFSIILFFSSFICSKLLCFFLNPLDPSFFTIYFYNFFLSFFYPYLFSLLLTAYPFCIYTLLCYDYVYSIYFFKFIIPYPAVYDISSLSSNLLNIYDYCDYPIVSAAVSN